MPRAAFTVNEGIAVPSTWCGVIFPLYLLPRASIAGARPALHLWYEALRRFRRRHGAARIAGCRTRPVSAARAHYDPFALLARWGYLALGVGPPSGLLDQTRSSDLPGYTRRWPVSSGEPSDPEFP